MQRNENPPSEKMSSHSGIFYKFYPVGDVDSALILSKGELLECSGGEGLELFVVGIIQGENLIDGITGNKGLDSLKSAVDVGING